MTSEKTRKRELHALVEVAEELHCDNHHVITCSQEEKIEWKATTIMITRINQF